MDKNSKYTLWMSLLILAFALPTEAQEKGTSTTPGSTTVISMPGKGTQVVKGAETKATATPTATPAGKKPSELDPDVKGPTPTPTPASATKKDDKKTDVKGVKKDKPPQNQGKKKKQPQKQKQTKGKTKSPQNQGKVVRKRRPQQNSQSGLKHSAPAQNVDGSDKEGTESGTQNGTDGQHPVVAVDGNQTGLSSGKRSCEDDAMLKVYNLALGDGKNILGQMYELTSMRLAARALKQDPKSATMEQMVRKDAEALAKKIDSIKGSAEIQKQVADLYELYGKGNDQKVISDDFNRAAERGKDACYWGHHQDRRYWNEHSSAYILAMSVAEKDAGISDIDAGTVWAVEHIRQAFEAKDPKHYAKGTYYGNLMNISTRVTRYLGKIEGGDSAEAAALDQKIKDAEAELEKELTEAFEKGKAQLAEDLKACFKDLPKNKDCEKCLQDDVNKYLGRLDVKALQHGLLSTVAREENLKNGKALKGEIGGISFDLSNFATGHVKRWDPSSRSSFDSCLKQGKKQAEPAAVPAAQEEPKQMEQEE